MLASVITLPEALCTGNAWDLAEETTGAITHRPAFTQ